MNLLVPLDHGWTFRRLDKVEDGTVCRVDLPHTPFVADLDGNEHWLGECEYERLIERPREAPTGPCTLAIGAAMHSAIILVDGAECGRHAGGYLPFEIDLTRALSDGRSHTLTVRLDNRDNPDVPPGKAFADLDFCWYGGLYRHAELRCYPPVHITDSVGAGVVAGGGIFVRTVALSPELATLDIGTHVRNTGAVDQLLHLHVEIFNDAGTVGRGRRTHLRVPAGSSKLIATDLNLARPRLWAPDAPNLHEARVTLRDADDRILDTAVVRFGIRRIHFSRSGGFAINGRRLRLRGTNRHQEYPRIGYAAPAAAQRRDARRIKEAGFDYVRLSHYPQSPAFLDACDELGILVMNCIPGWQFLGGDAFRAACYQNARDLIRRDRHHPCVVLWELSLNETKMDDAFMTRLHEIGHEEFPGDQMFTCGWKDRYDVFIHSRQHGELHTWRNGDKALVVAEYGDWEFYAATDGYDQKTGRGLYDPAGNGRKLRADGERGLRQQVSNHMVALNDTLGSPAVLDGQWSMFDYARGYDSRRAACGIMDIFRLPKFSYYFYRSQRHASEHGEGWSSGPMVFIASHWTAASALTIPVFTNCDEVELRLDNISVGRVAPQRDSSNAFLPHPPSVFQLAAFSAGTLEAIGFIGGRAVATHRVSTPTPAQRIELEIDSDGIVADDGEADVLIAHARVVDLAGTVCIDESPEIHFALEGDAEIVGPAAMVAEAGIASIVLRLSAGGAAFTLRARTIVAGRALTTESQWKRPETVAAEPQVPTDAPASAFK